MFTIIFIFPFFILLFLFYVPAYRLAKYVSPIFCLKIFDEKCVYPFIPKISDLSEK